MMVKMESGTIRPYDSTFDAVVPSRLTFFEKLALTCDLTTIDFDL
jgi:hypothetical protein